MDDQSTSALLGFWYRATLFPQDYRPCMRSAPSIGILDPSGNSAPHQKGFPPTRPTTSCLFSYMAVNSCVPLTPVYRSPPRRAVSYVIDFGWPVATFYDRAPLSLPSPAYPQGIEGATVGKVLLGSLPFPPSFQLPHTTYARLLGFPPLVVPHTLDQVAGGNSVRPDTIV